MKRIVVGFLALFVLLLSCAYSYAPDPCSTGSSRTAWKGDTSFTPEQRRAIRSALDEWREFTAGRVDQTIEFAPWGSSSEPRVVLVHSTDPIVREHEEDAAERAGLPGYVLWGWNHSYPQRIFIVVDRLDDDAVRRVMQHELGHAVGLRRSNCEDDCNHSDDPKAIMHETTGPTTFNDSDLAMCRASCLCD